MAAHLSADLVSSQVGLELELSSLDSSCCIEPLQENGKTFGEIVYIDRFGNLITNIPNTVVSLSVSSIFDCRINDHVINSISNTYSSVSKGDLLIFQGSHGFLEIARNQNSAMKFLNSKLGDKVVVG